jgi:predicted Zn-dependent protease
MLALQGTVVPGLRCMLRVARTPDQFAAVVGHEIGHAIANHANERLTQELAVQGGLMLP